MRPPISWADLAGRPVAVWGLGVEGRAAVRRLRDLGVEPVIVVDDPATVDDEVALPTVGLGIEAMANCFAVVKSPGISRYRPEVTRLEAVGVAVVGGLGLWLAEAPLDKVVCVTGTKGKSTTTAIMAHLARGLGWNAVAGGNIGVVPYEHESPDDVDLWVIEVSSYQAADVRVSPPVVAVTSLAPDHLPWHGGDVERYRRDKLSLCSHPGARLTVASAESEELRRHEALLGPEVRWVDRHTYPDPTWTAPLDLIGDHNQVNAAIARACLEAVGVPGADDAAAMRAAAEGFSGLDSRLERVATLGGVDFVDDSLSTNVLPTLAAVHAFPGRRVALIAGGFERDLDYAPLAAGLAARPDPTFVCTVYTTGPRIADEIRAVGAPHVVARPCADLAEAVRVAADWAAPDGVVLLSPAAASFDAFPDYAARAAAFRAAVASLRSLGAQPGN